MLKFNRYDKPIMGPVEGVNNGHTVQFDVNDVKSGGRPSVTGGLVNETFEAQSFHFHWGSKNHTGAEHVINRSRYAMELHIVHKNVKFASVDEAGQDPTGLLVLGIMLRRSPCWYNVPYQRTGLNEVYDVVPNLKYYKSTTRLKRQITMNSILSGVNTGQFYTYSGSLTTPPCSEAVTWVVFEYTVPIQCRYLSRFFDLYDDKNVTLLKNFRPIQPTKDRDVFYRKADYNKKKKFFGLG